MKSLGIENEKLEFKKSTAELREGITSLASMLNKNGYGVLYFGIKNNGEITGQQIGDRTLREISQAIANFIKPQVIPTIEHLLLDEKNVIKIEVSGYESPYSAYGRYYMRSADEDRELSPGALKELMKHKGESDTITVMEAPVQDLSFNKLMMAYVSAGLTVNPKTFEKNVGLIGKGGKYNYMSYLLADRNDISLKVVIFSGTDKTEMIKRNEYGGTCLLTAMDRVLDYMESINETKVEIGSHKRKETKLFDMASFKEAWQNACLHTKWDKGNPPTVYVFSDRIEIISTGGLPADLNETEFFRGISKPVNMKLQKLFGQLGYVEQTGHGVPLIISNYGKRAFEITEHFLNVVIPFNYQLSRRKYTKGKSEITYSGVEEKIIDSMREDDGITIREMVVELGFSDSYIRKVISKLKDKKVIERKGGRKEGRWLVRK